MRLWADQGPQFKSVGSWLTKRAGVSLSNIDKCLGNEKVGPGNQLKQCRQSQCYQTVSKLMRIFISLIPPKLLLKELCEHCLIVPLHCTHRTTPSYSFIFLVFVVCKVHTVFIFLSYLFTFLFTNTRMRDSSSLPSLRSCKGQDQGHSL